jgi:hypothetical protein
MTASAADPAPVAPEPDPGSGSDSGAPPSAEVARRRRITAAGLALAVVALIVGLVLGLSGGSAAPPDTGAARLVPAGALAYMNVSLDRSRPGVSRTRRLASSLPGFSLLQAAVQSRLAALTGDSAFSRRAPPWLGDEAALAVLAGTGSQAGSLVLLRARRPAAARRYLSGISSAGTVSYRGVGIRQLTGGSYVAMIRGYVVAGQLASVRQALDVARGGAPSLSGAQAFRRASANEAPGRVLDLYAPASGINALLGGRGGALGALRTLLSAPGLTAASVSLSAAPGGVRVRVHSMFAPGVARSAGTSFDPWVLRRLPAGTVFALDSEQLRVTGRRLLDAVSQLGIGGAVGPLLNRLGGALSAEHFDLTPLVNLFGGQTAVAVTATGGRPDVLVLTRTKDPASARIVLANLAPPLASLFPASSSGPGVAPLFTGIQVAGMTIHQLKLGPGLQVDYTVWHHLVGVSTSVAALTALARRTGSLGSSRPFQSAFGTAGVHAGSVVFLDLKVLIRLGEQTGLLHGPGFARLAPDLDRVSVAGLRAWSSKTDSTSELYLNIP